MHTGAEQKSGIKIPKYNVPGVYKLREKLTVALMDYVGTLLTGENFEDFCQAAHAVLPHGVDQGVLSRSLYTLAGEQLTEESLNCVAWRVAGNLHSLRQNVPSTPWTSQDAKEWVPVQVEELLPGKNRYGEGGAYAHLRVLAGTPCPRKLLKFWTWRHMTWLARFAGFTPHWKNEPPFMPYRRGAELTSLRLMVLLEPDLMRDGEPGYKETDFTSGILNWNKRILMARNHIDPPCPKDYDHHCHQCFIGYDQCQAACHPVTWEWGFCPECKQEWWLDPSHPRKICPACMEAGR